MKNNFDYVLQEDMFDCGVAALKTIFLQFGKHIKEDDIVHKKINQGLSALELINASKKLGLDACGVKSDLNNFDFNQLPCIAHVIKDKNFYHYIVILKNNKNKRNLIVMDPAIGIVKLPYSEFNKMTTGIFIIFNQQEFIKEHDKRFKYLLLKIFKSNKKIIVLTLLLSLLIITLSLIFNYYLTFILKSSFNFNNIIVISATFLIIAIIKNIIQYFRDKIIILLNKKIDQDINKKVIDHMIKLPYKYYCNKKIGESVSLINDIENVKNIVTKIFILLSVDIILIATILLFVSFYSIYYLTIFIVLVVILLLLSLIYQKIFYNNFLTLKKEKINFNSHLVEIFGSFSSIKNLRLEKKIIKKTNEMHNTLLNYGHTYDKSYNKYKFLNNSIIEIFYILTIFVCCLFELNFNNQLFNIVLFSNLFYLFIDFINNVNDNITSYKVYKASVFKVLDVIEEKEEEQSSKKITFKEISFKDISFNYGNKNILKDLNFKITAGDKILLYGVSGIGKSTLIKILLKYYALEEGNIYFDNINSKYIEGSVIRESISYVSQDETIFNDTLYNNLAIINNNEKEIEKALKICRITIDKNYVLEENGANLSGGERKKILIARALLRNRNLVIYDESFNEIDQSNERIILQNIINNYKNLTIILISHRLNNSFLFNKRYELKNGKLIKEEKV